MTQVYDAGAFIAAGRGDRAMWRRLKSALDSGVQPVTTAAVIGQVWGGGARQANVARLLNSVDAVPLTADVGRATGALLGQARTTDVIDAAVVLSSVDGDVIYTSDPTDIAHLARSAGLHVEIVPV